MAGAGDINSFDDAIDEARIARSVYATTKQTLLQQHPWSFSLIQLDLGGELVDDPLFKWRYKYQLPANLLRVIALENSEDYEIYGRQLYTDVSSPARIVCQLDITEDKMPSYFISSLELHLAKKFAVSLSDNMSKAQMFESMADKETARARNIDSQQKPLQAIPDRNFTLLTVRG
jgi:hypothetical protein